MKISEICDLLKKELLNSGYEYGFYLDGKKYKPDMSKEFDEEFDRALHESSRIQAPEDTERGKFHTILTFEAENKVDISDICLEVFMEEISLRIMTRQLCRELYSGWENDPAIYMDMDKFVPYRYDVAAVDRYFDARQEPSRVLFAIMRDGRPIGELQLKGIDREHRECTLSIHMQNDAVKGRGYGTIAEKLALKYAFDTLGMTAVNADTVLKNTRSQHVLEKVGFKYLEEKDGFKYYRFTH